MLWSSKLFKVNFFRDLSRSKGDIHDTELSENFSYEVHCKK